MPQRDRRRARRCIERIQSHRVAVRHVQPSTPATEAPPVYLPAPTASDSLRGVSPRVIRARQRVHRYGLFSAPKGVQDTNPKRVIPKSVIAPPRQVRTMRLLNTAMARNSQRRLAKEIAILAAEIRQVRTQLSLSQGQLAERLGVSQQTVSDWEKGKRLRQVHVALRLGRLLAL